MKEVKDHKRYKAGTADKDTITVDAGKDPKKGHVVKVNGFDYGSAIYDHDSGEDPFIKRGMIIEWLRECVGKPLVKFPVHISQVREILIWACVRYQKIAPDSEKLTAEAMNDIVKEVWRCRRHKGSVHEESKNKAWVLRNHTTQIGNLKEAFRVLGAELREDFYMGTLEIKCKRLGYERWTPIERNVYSRVHNGLVEEFVLMKKIKKELSDGREYPAFEVYHLGFRYAEYKEFVRGIAAENRVIVFKEDYLDKLPEWEGKAECEKPVKHPSGVVKPQGWHPDRSTIVRVFEKYLKFNDNNQVSRELMRFAFPAGMRAAVCRQIRDEEYAFDYLTVIIGQQGIGKSKMWKYLIPGAYEGGKTGWVVNSLRFDRKGGDPVELATRMKGAVIAEARECIGLRTCDIERIKAIIDTDIDQERFKYGEFRADQKRTCWMVGNSNDDKVLPGEWEGMRRMIAIKLDNEMEDDEATAKMYADIKKWRDQMWSEALYLAEQKHWDKQFFIIPTEWITASGENMDLRSMQRLTARHHSTDWEIMEVLFSVVNHLDPQEEYYPFTLKDIAEQVASELGEKQSRGLSRKVGQILDSINKDAEIQKRFSHKIHVKRARVTGPLDNQPYAGVHITVTKYEEASTLH